MKPVFLFLVISFGLFAGNGNAYGQQSRSSWVAQSNIYEVNLRQYSSSGSIKDFQKHLPRLKQMGVEILWFMPITPIGKVGRKMTESDLGSYYAVRDYKAVNEEFGTMADWISLVKKAHGMGFKVITDWVANHSAIDNPWMKDHPDFYTRDSAGNAVSPFDWTDVKKLNYANRGLRDSMISAMKFWLTTGIDGFRCDVAEEVPVDFWRTCIGKLKEVRPVFMLAEGDKPWLHEAGFDETYAWSLMGPMSDLVKGKMTLVQFDSVLNHNIAIYPTNAYRLYFTTNHDENSWNGTEFEKYGDAYKAFAVFTQTMYQSVPLIYSGQEIPNRKRLKFFVKDTIGWKGRYEMAPFYSALLKLRRSNPALAADAAYQRLPSSNDEAIFAYQREKGGRRVVVMLNFSSETQLFKIRNGVLKGRAMDLFKGKKRALEPGSAFGLEPWGYTVLVY
ncbi:MAG: DUF3459 domain-containing protein [Chitinophagaceae bacterium]|nr:DUF3459 domain-containing protein [Chitinophagaceae bacterium]